MKVKYFYDAQLRRTLKHLIRMFGEFQVLKGFKDDGTPVYKTVPCRYADFSRQAMYLINGASENVLNSAPIMTISIQNLKMDRQGIRAPVARQSVIATNKSTNVNEYSNQIDNIQTVAMVNPVPYELTFNLNIWTTTLQNKMELWEQIITLFDPAVELQYNENPLDWTSLTNVELVDSNFNGRSVPQGTSNDIDISTLTFKCIIYFSNPANVTKTKMIEQIVTNMRVASDELSIDFNDDTILLDVYTPNNLSISCEKVDKPNVYKLKLLNSAGRDKTANGFIYSWIKYLTLLDPEYHDKDIGIKFLKSYEDPFALKSNVINIDSESENIMYVELDPSQMNIKYTVDGFIESPDDIPDGDDVYVVSISDKPFEIDSVLVEPSDIIHIKNSVIEVYKPENRMNVYTSHDSMIYTWTPELGWHQVLNSLYRAGYWRILIG